MNTTSEPGRVAIVTGGSAAPSPNAWPPTA